MRLPQKLSLPVLETSTRQLTWIWLLRIVVVCLPALLTFLIINVYLGQSIKDYTPQFPNDEIDYYRENMAFSKAGFEAGYFTMDEHSAPASFIHYGAHGPFYPMVYGPIMRLEGHWQPYKTIYLNVIVLMLALGFYVAYTRPDYRQLLLILLALGTFYPLWFNLLSAMQEVLHISIAIVLAALIIPLWQKAVIHPFAKVLFFLFIAFASLLRFTWCIFFVIYFLLLIDTYTFRKIILAVVAGIAVSLPFYLIFSYTAAPYPYNVMTTMAKTGSLSESLALIRENMEANWEIATQEPLEQVLYLQALVLIVASVGFWLYQKKFQSPWMIHFLNVAPMIVFAMTLHFVGLYFGYRAVAVHILLSLLVLIGFRKYTLVALLLGINLLGLSAFTGIFESELDQRFNQDKAMIETVKVFSDQYLFYDADTENAWCNTVLTTFEYYQYYMLGLPDEMGLSMVFDSELDSLKSKYLFFPPPYYHYYRNRIDAEIVAAAPFGTALIINHSSDCETPVYPDTEPLSEQLEPLYQGFVEAFQPASSKGVFVSSLSAPIFGEDTALYLRRILNSGNITPDERDYLLKTLALIEYSLIKPGEVSEAWQSYRLPGDIPGSPDYLLLSRSEQSSFTPLQMSLILLNPRFYEPVGTFPFGQNRWTAYVLEQPWETYDLFRIQSDANVNTLGLSSDDYENFIEAPMPFGLAEDDVILNPTTGVLVEQAPLFPIYGIYLAEDAAPVETAAFFNILKVLPLIQSSDSLSHEQQPALSTWSSDANPDALDEAGIEYVIFDAVWLSQQSPEVQANLTDPNYYRQLPDWELDVYGNGFHLYQIISQN